MKRNNTLMREKKYLFEGVSLLDESKQKNGENEKIVERFI